MNNEEVKAYLGKHTNMSKYDIERHIRDGYEMYPNNGKGYTEFADNLLAALFDVEDVPECWEQLEVIGDYKFDWTL